MTEIQSSSIPSLPKDFQKENEQISSLISILNQINIAVDFIHKTFQIQSKSNSPYHQKIIQLTTDCKTDIQSNQGEIKLKLSDLLTTFLSGMTDYFSKLQIVLGEKYFTEIIEQINNKNSLLLKKIEELPKDCNSLSALRVKYKNFDQKEAKILKEMDSIYTEKKGIDADDKKSYNITLKERNEELLMNKVNEFDLNKEQKIAIYQEGKSLEKKINNQLNDILSTIVHTFSFNLSKLKEGFEKIVEQYKSKINDILITTLRPLLNDILKIENDKTVPIEDINLERDWNKMNYLQNDIPRKVLLIANDEMNKISYQKKILNSFLKSINAAHEETEDTMSQFTKDMKSLSIPILTKKKDERDEFIIQILSYLKSIFDQDLKKFDDRQKCFKSELISKIEHCYKETVSEENQLGNYLNKLNKEIQNFKTQNVKMLTEQEKLETDFNQMKNQVESDPSSFPKFEKNFVNVKADIDKIKSKLYDAFQKVRPTLNDFNENVIKKLIPKRQKRNEERFSEIKKGCINVISLEDKILNQMNEYFQYKNQIKADEESVNKYIRSTFFNFGKKFNLDIPEKNIEELLLRKEEDKNNSMKIYQMINTEEVILNNETDISKILPSDLVSKYRKNLEVLKQGNKELTMKNLNTRKLFEDIFPLDEDEEVIIKYSAALREGLLLQGKLYLTNKKVIFYSWFNNNTLFGKTLIIIPKEDINRVEKKENIIFSNMIEVKAKNAIYLFCSMINREECYLRLRNLCFNEPLPEGVNLLDKENSPRSSRDKISLEDIGNKSLDNSLNLINNQLDNEEEKNNMMISTEESKNPEENTASLKDTLSAYTQERLSSFLNKNKRTFNSNDVKDLSLGDVSLPEIFNAVYNPEKNIPILGNKSFYLAYAEKRQDYNLEIEKPSSYETVPKFFLNGKSTEILNADQFMITEDNKQYENIKTLKYMIKCTHPILKKRFGGPSKLDITDKTTVYFISPLCMVVEVISNMTGFMLMDTFISILRYTYETKINIDQENKITYDTKVSVSLAVEFVKDTWWKNRITSEAMGDNSELIKEIIIPLIQTVLNEIKDIKNKPECNLDYLFGVVPEKLPVMSNSNNVPPQRKQSIPSINNAVPLKDEIKVNSIINTNDVIKNLTEKIDHNSFLLVGGVFLIIAIFLMFRNELAFLSILNIVGFGMILFQMKKMQEKIERIENNQTKRMNEEKKE